MNHHDEQFLPLEVDEQIEQLARTNDIGTSLNDELPNARMIEQLQHLYHKSSETNAASVEHVWQRLVERRSDWHYRQSQQARLPIQLRPQRERRYVMQKTVSSMRRQPLLGSIVAAVLVMIVVGSIAGLIMFMHHSNGSNAGSGTPLAHTHVYGAAIYVLHDQNIMRLDAKTGAKQWQHKLDEDTALFWGIEVVNNKVYYCDSNYILHILDASSGKELRSVPHLANTNETFAPFEVRNNLVYLLFSDGSLHKEEVITGKEYWKKLSSFSTFTVKDNTVYALSARNGLLYALDARTGTTSWTMPVSNGATPIDAFFSKVYVVGGEAYARVDYGGSESVEGADKLFAFDAVHGTQLWSMSFATRTLASVDLNPDGTAVYVTTGAFHNPQTFSAYDAKTAKVLWHTLVSEQFLLQFDQRNIFIVSARKVYALDEDTGRNLWVYNIGEPVTNFTLLEQHTLYIEAYAARNGSGVFAPFALDQKGHVLWRCVPLQLSMDNPNGTAELDGVIYTGFFGSDTIRAIRSSDGKELWRVFVGETGTTKMLQFLTAVP